MSSSGYTYLCDGCSHSAASLSAYPVRIDDGCVHALVAPRGER